MKRGETIFSAEPRSTVPGGTSLYWTNQHIILARRIEVCMAVFQFTIEGASVLSRSVLICDKVLPAGTSLPFTGNACVMVNRFLQCVWFRFTKFNFNLLSCA